jgi:hypothetical protein
MQAGVPKPPYRRIVLGGLISVLVAALGIIALLRGLGIDDLDRDEDGLRHVFTEAADLVGDLSGSLLTLDVGALPDVADRLRAATAGSVAFFCLLFVLATYLVLRPVVASFRVKRAMLAASGAGSGERVSPGAYVAETRALRHPPAEVPLDLVVLAMPMLIPLYIGGFMLVRSLAVEWSVAALVDAVVLLVLGAARLIYLAQIARLRKGLPLTHVGRTTLRSRARSGGEDQKRGIRPAA